MASVISKLMTAEEFYDWSQLWENRDRNFELDAGRLIELPLTGQRKSFVCGKVCWLLGNYCRQYETGYVCSNNVGLILERNPDTVFGPDVALFLDIRRFDELETGYCEHMPALAVDVLSNAERQGTIQKRVNKFLKSGIQMLWIIDTDDRKVIANLPDRPPLVLEADEDVTGFAVLPDFRCKVSDFFVMAGQTQ